MIKPIFFKFFSPCSSIVKRILVVFFLLSCSFVNSQSFVTWNEGFVECYLSTLTSITGTYPFGTVTVSNTGIGQDVLIGTEFCLNNLEGATGNQVFGTWGPCIGTSRSLTFTFSTPVIINSFNVHDIDMWVDPFDGWYDVFTFSGVVFSSVTAGNGVSANTTGIVGTPEDLIGQSCYEYANWFNSTQAVSSFTINYNQVSTNTHAYLGYSMKVSPPTDTTLNIVGINEICLGDSVLLTAINDTIHQWALGSAPNNIISMGSSIYVSPTVTTDYQVYGTADTAYFTVNVSNPPVSQIDFGSDTTICEGDFITLNAGSASTYLWSTGSTDDTINVFTSGNYWVVAANGVCSATDTILVSVIQYPTPDLGNDDTLCIGLTRTLNAGIADSYLWSNGSTGATLSVFEEGTYWVTASNGSCSETDSVKITVNDYPVPDFVSDTILCEGQVLSLNGGTADSYIWSTGSTGPMINVSSPDTYWVTATNGVCVVTDSIVVTFSMSVCESALEIPNIFTPNGDGANDFFTPLVSKNIASMETRIYNRWGNQVFETDDLWINWSGKDHTEGTYFWRIQYTENNGTENKTNGFLTLIR